MGTPQAAIFMATHQRGTTFIVSISVDEAQYKFVKESGFNFSRIMRKALVELMDKHSETSNQLKEKVEQLLDIIKLKENEIESLKKMIGEKVK